MVVDYKFNGFHTISVTLLHNKQQLTCPQAGFWTIFSLIVFFRDLNMEFCMIAALSFKSFVFLKNKICLEELTCSDPVGNGLERCLIHEDLASVRRHDLWIKALN